MWKKAFKKKHTTKLHNRMIHFGRFQMKTKRKLHAIQFIHHQSEIIQQTSGNSVVFFSLYGFVCNTKFLCKTDHRFAIHNTHHFWKVHSQHKDKEERERKLSFRKVFELSIKHLHWNNLQICYTVAEMYAQNLCHSTFAIHNANVWEMTK